VERGFVAVPRVLAHHASNRLGAALVARIRSIKLDLFIDDGLADVSVEAHLLLAGLPCIADSAGRLEDRPRRIHAQLFPYRPSVDVGRCLDELAATGHVTRYAVDGKCFIQVNNWESDQRPHVKEPGSDIPPVTDSTEHRQSSDVAGKSPVQVQGKNAGILGVGSGVLDLGVGGSLALQAAPKPKKRKGGKAEPAGDPRHAPLVQVLVEECGYPFRDGRDAFAVSRLLALADQQEATQGEAAVPEVVRRARIGWAWVGFPACRSLSELVTNWGHYATEQRKQAPPRADDGIHPPGAEACAGCGTAGDGASVGEPHVWLGYACGCMTDWTHEGLHYTKAQGWAKRRRDGPHDG